ncbi:MAG: hypothetical protein ABIP36_01185, partial [Acidimicrobiales bacterium]
MSDNEGVTAFDSDGVPPDDTATWVEDEPEGAWSPVMSTPPPGAEAGEVDDDWIPPHEQPDDGEAPPLPPHEEPSVYTIVAPAAQDGWTDPTTLAFAALSLVLL